MQGIKIEKEIGEKSTEESFKTTEKEKKMEYKQYNLDEFYRICLIDNEI